MTDFKKLQKRKRIGKMKLVKVYKFGREGKIEIKDYTEKR